MSLSFNKTFWLGFLMLLALTNGLLLFFYLSLPRPGRCLVLQEKYCKKGRLIYYNGRPFALGFLLPEKTPVFSPFSGELYPATLNPGYPALRVATGIKGRHIWQIERSFSAVFFREKIALNKAVTVRKGQIIGKVGQKTLNEFGPYNLIVYFSVPDENHRLAIDESYTLKLFGL